MCGRFTLTIDPAQLRLALPWLDVPEATNFTPRYNISPTQPVAVVPNDGKHRLDFFTWGLIPSWAKDPSIGSNLINARGESVAEKPSFRTAFKRRRCLILTDGFYEWQKSADGKSKTPMYIRMASGQPFAFAGLWEWWTPPGGDGSEIRSCTIITTEPNSLMAPIHNRMPVILPPETYEAWLEPSEQRPENLLPLIRPYPAEAMMAYPVSKLVNSPANDRPACVAAVSG
jgi:putative SOS response-associated peptidase YedK